MINFKGTDQELREMGQENLKFTNKPLLMGGGE